MARAQEADDGAELAAEQTYFDEALERREHQREGLSQAPTAAPHKGAAAGLKKFADEAIGRLRPPDEAVAFGRFDNENEESWYVGYNAIWSEDRDILVVNWQAPVAAPYFEATHEAPLDVRFRRAFECEGNKILSFDDVVFLELAAEVATLLAEPEMDDALLSELARARTGEMQDIVKTIQAAQYQIIRQDLDQLLVVQGGAGTGKTAVGLHRVSWLIYNHRDRLDARDVVVVGPNKTFTRYIRSVLPTLGDDGVLHAELESLLATRVRVGREESQELTRLKGQLRMAKLLERGLRDRVRFPEDGLELRVAGSVVTLGREEVQGRIRDSLQLPYSVGRQRMRDYLRDEVSRQTGQARTPDETTDSLLERIWPQITAASFLQDLLGSKDRLISAAGEDFSAADVTKLYRRASDRLAEETWSSADIPLLDHADSLIRGEAARQFSHIVVDEAQDLSPMQLKMIARRSPKGSMTVLGDLAQSTGSWARDSWDDVIEQLRGSLPVNQVELEFGYRVPRQVFEVAAEILKVAAPMVAAPRVVRDGPSSPKFLHASEHDRSTVAIDAARDYAGRGHLVGIICSAASRAQLEQALTEHDVRWSSGRDGTLGSPITLLTAWEAKGLEFDSVVVLEPEEIVAEDPRGLRLLYIALTRTIRHLTVVHAGAALPLEQGPGATPMTDVVGPKELLREGGDLGEVGSLLDGIAGGLASQVRQLIQPQHWDLLLDRLRDELISDEDADEDSTT